MQYHAPMPLDLDALARRRKELQIEEKLRQMKQTTSNALSTAAGQVVDDQAKQMSVRAKMAKDVLKLIPKPSESQKEERKRYRERMKQSLFLPTQRPSPNTSELTDQEIAKARIVNASAIAHDSDLLRAQEYLDSDPKTMGWKIDGALSNEDHLVLTKGDEIKVAFRGTKWRNLSDLITNASNAADRDMMAPQNRRGAKVIEDILAKYGEKPKELLGYSKGGNSALNIGDITEIPTTVFNASIGPRQLSSISKVPHTVINTVDDPISMATYFRKKSNYTIKRIRSIRGENPIAQHKLSNFTQRGINQPSGLEKLSHELIGKGQNLGHVETYDAMRQGVESGMTFTQALDEFNKTQGNVQRVDVTPDGGLGERIHRSAPTVRYWQDAGGSFTPREEAHLRMQPVPKKVPISAEARSMGIVEGDTILPSQKAIMNRSPDSRRHFVEQ